MGAMIDGKAISGMILKETKSEILALKEKGITPRLRVIIIGEDPASVSYVTGKARTAREIGIDSETIRLPTSTTERELLALVQKLNSDRSVNAILVQSPLPDLISEERAFAAISPIKDADGFHPENIGLLTLGTPRVLPCTPWGIQELLVRSGNPPDGRHVVIVGRSNLVGRPLSILLSLKQSGSNATVTLCHSRTKDLKNHTLQADILVAAIGMAHCIKADLVPDDCVVIDVGVNRIPDASKKSGHRLVGDVEFDAVLPMVRAITPVPGGVGPMTVAMLMKNTVRLCRMQNEGSK
jgi:methylenetetrahydrofolate dehydrogenase (NADP+)/methenyltetrahydrofolate cyclohydrolase